jgi:5'-nucleotidase
MSLRINGRAILPNQKLRVAVNNFLAAGGDGFTVFEQGANRLGGDIDVDALVAYIRAHSPVRPGPLRRVTRLD